MTLENALFITTFYSINMIVVFKCTKFVLVFLQTSSLSLSKNARVLLQKVHRGKWRNQDDYGGKVKDKIKTHAFRKWGQQKY